MASTNVNEIETGFAQIKWVGARAPESFLSTHDIGANLGTSSAGGHGNTPLPRK